MSTPQIGRAREHTKTMRIKQARKVCELKWMPEEVILIHIPTSVYGALICA